AAARDIHIRTESRATSVEADAVILDSGERLPSTLTFWVAGAAAHRWVADSQLPTDARGYIPVTDDLQVSGCEGLFAVGDCAALESWPEIPKAGVYAVRQGPVLADNLRALLEERPLKAYRAQRDFLTLLNLGDGAAIGARWGRALTSGLMWRLKDRIDRRFMARFQVLGTGGARLEAFSEGMPTMAEMEMVCGGCAAKVGQTPLHRALARLPPSAPDPDVILGAAESEDVVAFRHLGGVVVGNFDAFTAFTDDPWLVGRAGALNAVSDLLAKGTAPRYAMAAVTIPRGAPQEECLFQALAGVRAALDPLGTQLLGGHTMLGEVLSVGLHVTGFAEQPLWTMAGLQPGDVLILTRPLGTGVLWNADMSGDAAGRWMEAVTAEMIAGNAIAADVARGHPISGATDVTGFGLAGHVAEMARASGLSVRIFLDRLPAYPGAIELLAAGRRSTAHEENQRVLKVMVAPGALADDPRVALLFDPQTTGGLLLGVSSSHSTALVAALQAAGAGSACVVATVEPPRTDQALVVIDTSA
ncbi:MAG: selenide,water dikinase, partial [Myxococcota bacterium]